MISGELDDDGADSVTQWIDRLKQGDSAAAQPLWERYYSRLVRLARGRLIANRRRGADEDEEDAALSAFNSFCIGAAEGRFPMLSDRENLWRLLIVITTRKAGAQAQRRRAAKRGGDWHRLAADAPSQDDRLILEELADGEPTPEFASMVAEQYELLLDQLGDDDLRRVALWRLEGWSNDEIAERLGCARRTVARRLDLIRKIWSAGDS